MVRVLSFPLEPARFSEQTLQKIAQLKEVYGMDYDASASHRLTEGPTHKSEA